MKRIRLMGLSLLALFALGAFASSSAFAELPEILPAPNAAEPLTFNSKQTSASALLEATKGEKNKITCKAATNKGEFTSQDSGLVLIDFTGCESNGVKCNSPKDEPGVILVLGDIQLVDILPGAVLGLGLWLEPHEENNRSVDLHIECGGVLTIVILGSLIAKVDGVTSGVAFEEAKVLWHQTKGEQEIKTCMTLEALCGKAEANKFSLLADFGKGHELAGEEVEVLINGFKKNGIAVKPVVDF